MKTLTAKKETEAKWAERVREWRASGESGHGFASRRDFSVSALYAWAGRIPKTDVPHFLRVVPKPTECTAAPAPLPQALSEIVIEVGSVRIRVGAGCDRALLADVVRSLGGDAK